MAENVSSLEERLAQLRPRLIVAFAVRCARRVQPRLIMNFDHWGNDELRAIISQVDSGLSNLENGAIMGISFRPSAKRQVRFSTQLRD